MTDLSGWKVLLVEDEIDARDVLVTVLEQYSPSIQSAFTGEEALELLRIEHPTVVIIDLALPSMDGWQLLNAMRSDPALVNIPAVAMTAFHSTNVAQKAIEAGFAAYFPKPINARTFVEDLVAVLN